LIPFPDSEDAAYHFGMSTEHLPASPTPPDTPGLLTYSEAARFLGIRLGTLYALVAQRRVPHVRLGSRLVRFEPVALEAYIAARRVDAAT